MAQILTFRELATTTKKNSMMKPLLVDMALFKGGFDTFLKERSRN